MSSIVRPSMRGALFLMWTARAIGPSSASMRHWIARYRKTRRGSGCALQTSAAAKKAKTTPDAVNRWTKYPRARCAGVTPGASGIVLCATAEGALVTCEDPPVEAELAAASSTPRPLAHVSVLLAFLLALGLLLHDLVRVLVVLGLRRRLRLLRGGFGVAAQLDQHRKVIGSDVLAHAQVDQLELVGMKHVVQREAEDSAVRA